MKILFADDHTIVRDAIKIILKSFFPLAEIGEADDAISLIKLVNSQQWDVIIIDITMPPGDSGLDAVRQIKKMAPAIPMIVMSMHAAQEYAIRALKAGASGYLLKEAAPNELVIAINQVLSGRKYLSEAVAIILADAFESGYPDSSLASLTNRELEVFKLLAHGKAISFISNELSLSQSTIAMYRASIFKKLNLNNNMELIKFAVTNNLFIDN